MGETAHRSPKQAITWLEVALDRNAGVLLNVLNPLRGWIDLSRKRPSDIYVDIMLAAQQPGANPNVDMTKLATFMTDLGEKGYSVFAGGLSLIARGPNVSSGVADISDRTVCDATPPHFRPPCIIYMRPELKEKAQEIARLAAGV
jgi:hypothetical protein